MGRKSKDVDLAIIERVLSEPVPPRGDMSNPYKKAADGGLKQLGIRDVDRAMRFPENPDDWTLRKLVDYFEYKVKDASGLNYRGIYKSDCPSFQKYAKQFADQGLHRYLWCKELIDWAVERRAEIVKRYKYLTVQTLEHVVNEFMQEHVMPLVEEDKVERNEPPDEPFLEEIAEACAASRRLEVFGRFGIPVMVTYYVKIKGEDEEKLIEGLRNALSAAMASPENKALVERIGVNSIVGSPYPSWMLALDWRSRLPEFVKKISVQRWWRDQDFKGRSLAKYDSLNGGK
jgi:hypothetical protein